MRSATIYERNNWRVVSYGNGTAYLLEYQAGEGPASSALFQGDDAEFFREHTMGEDGFFVDCCEERFADYSEIMETTEGQ